ncbi:MAG: MMPL family transporter [Methanomassiliicoccus sp.]|nr:MMPL family transporter [Methanomassiliicoccus sp.]
MFAGLADLITRRFKLIIIAWIIALLFALPLVPLASHVVQYEETEMAPATLPSSVANEYISASFGSFAHQPTTLIVLTSPDVTDNETRRVALEIEDALGDASLFGDINKVEVTSVYSLSESYTLNVVKALNYAYYSANLSAYLFFGIPQEYRDLWARTNESATALYGVSEGYAQAWEQAAADDPSRTVQQVDDATYSAFHGQLETEAQGMNASERALLLGWYHAFSAGWNSTASLSSQPQQRAVAAHSAAFQPFLDSLDLPSTDKDFLTRVNDSFANRPADFANVSEFARQVVDENIEATIAEVSSGQISYGNVSTGQVALVRDYMDAVYSWWSTLGSQPSDETFDAALQELSLNFSQAVADGETREVLLGSRAAVGNLTNYNDLALRSSLITGYVASMPAVAERLAPQKWLVAAAGEMGSFDLNTAVALSQAIVANSSLDSYPYRFPSVIISQLVSADNSTMVLGLTYADVDGDLHPGRECVDAVRSIVAGVVDGTNVRYHVTGTDALNTDMEESTFEDLRIIEPITIVLVLVLIGLFFRSFVASSIPPLAVGVALGISYAAVYLIGAYVFSVHYAVLTLLLTAMIGAGCDYCIFILSRYREERGRGRDKVASVRQAVIWAGESILTSGATVIIGFGVLAIGEFSLFKSLGVILALGITVALLVALTLLPSILMLLGDRTFWPSRVGRPAKPRTRPGYFTRSARFSIKHAKVLLVAAILVSIPATCLTMSVNTSYDYIGSMADMESKQGLMIIQDGFGGGKITPTQIAVEMDSPVMKDDAFDPTMLSPIENLSATIASLDNVKMVIGPTRPYGSPVDITNSSLMESLSAITGRMVSEDRRAVLLTVTFQAEPFDMRSIDSIQELRDVASEVQGADHVENMLVGGSTASMFDIAVMTQGDFGRMAVLAIACIYIVLMAVMGSVVSPLRSILTILLSISWTMAVALVLFQDVLGQPILYLAPMILLLVCLGLGMDYDILLTTRVREEVAKGRSNNDAIVHAVEQTGGIITACGIIMAAAFGSMMLSNGYLLREFGFVLMFAILLDATIVRIYLVPAIMSLLGDWNWWAPSVLRKMNERRNKGRLATLAEAGAAEHALDDERGVS